MDGLQWGVQIKADSKNPVFWSRSETQCVCLFCVCLCLSVCGCGIRQVSRIRLFEMRTRKMSGDTQENSRDLKFEELGEAESVTNVLWGIRLISQRGLVSVSVLLENWWKLKNHSVAWDTVNQVTFSTENKGSLVNFCCFFYNKLLSHYLCRVNCKLGLFFSCFLFFLFFYIYSIVKTTFHNFLLLNLYRVIRILFYIFVILISPKFLNTHILQLRINEYLELKYEKLGLGTGIILMKVTEWIYK